MGLLSTHHYGENSVDNSCGQISHIFNGINGNWCRDVSRPIAQWFCADRCSSLHRHRRHFHCEFHPAVTIERSFGRGKWEIAIRRWLGNTHECRAQTNVSVRGICAIVIVARQILHVRWPFAALQHWSRRERKIDEKRFNGANNEHVFEIVCTSRKGMFSWPNRNRMQK